MAPVYVWTALSATLIHMKISAWVSALLVYERKSPTLLHHHTNRIARLIACDKIKGTLRNYKKRLALTLSSHEAMRFCS